MQLRLRGILRHKNFTPVQIIAMGFATIIFTGALLLSLPIATIEGVRTPFIDCIFTSTSAVCVTGLITVDTGTYWNYFGKTVILILIQIGGLGFMSFTTLLALIVRKKITLKERLVIRESLNSTSLQGIVKLARYILRFTFSIELIGAILLSFEFIPEFGIIKGIYYSIFHAVSAFCNAGFDLMGEYTSLTAYSDNTLVILTLSSLIIIGGLGFYVWNDIFNYKHTKRLTLQTKLVISMSVGLVLFGFIMFLIFEISNPETLEPMSIRGKLLSAFFASVSPRTAGFNSIDLTSMTIASTFLTIVLMFIGGSPGSTAGGIKTSTAGVLFMTIISVINGREDTELFKRRINKETVYKSLSVVVIALALVFTVTILLSITERASGAPFEHYLFEATSAFGTVGLTLGLTQELTTIGKAIVALTMYAGRIGPLTLVLAISIRKRKRKNSIKYPEDKILVG
ncbi:TrkH family potassium uptake protein [uncultured Clostridium sp.]|uniref:TrkH family potassium uptake protein n=1 Tax=uncultured Clostridium sp. TaxID=59620 RepID=UPI003217C510